MPPTRTLYVDNKVDRVIEKLLYELFLQAGPVWNFARAEYPVPEQRYIPPSHFSVCI